MLILVTIDILGKKVYHFCHVYRLLKQYFSRCVSALHKPLTDWGKKQPAEMKVVQGDYLASNRVLAPTLRLKPFSITAISADVAPASPDPPRASSYVPPLCLQVHCFSARSFCQAPWSAEGDWGPWGGSHPHCHSQCRETLTSPVALLPPPFTLLLQSGAKIDTGVSLLKKPLRGRQAPLSQWLISQLMCLIGILKLWGADPQLSH